MAAIYGTNGSDNLVGTDFADISIFGYAGNDIIDGKGGDDIIDGGTGNDDIFGGEGNDTILGRDGGDTLKGSNGSDAIFGEGGNDSLWGGSGIDYLYGGTGNDTYLLFEDVSDTIVEYLDQGIDTVKAYSNYILPANVENLELYNAATIGTGNGLGNRIIGNNRADTLYGLGGNDGLEGRGGGDTLYGGVGSDVLFGDSAIVGQFTGNDYLYGNEGDDSLYGGRGYDYLNGGSGRDYLDGAGGINTDIYEVDTLAGGFGADTFGLGYRTASGSSAIYYRDSGFQGFNKFAVIQDFNVSDGDRIRVGSAVSEYSLVKDRSYFGTTALDTAIFRYGDLIAIVQDNVAITSTNLYLG